MKKLLLALLIICGIWFPSTAKEAKFPAPTGPVFDETGTLSEDDRAQLQTTIKNIANFEVAVAVLSNTRDMPEEEYGYQLGREWGVGDEATDNGVLIMVVPSQREVRIETGYGTETVLTDAEAGKLLDAYAVPYFKKGAYGEGIVKLTEQLSAFLKDKQVDPRVKISTNKHVKSQREIEDIAENIVTFIFFFSVFLSCLAKTNYFKKLSVMKILLISFVITQVLLILSCCFFQFMREAVFSPAWPLIAVADVTGTFILLLVLLASRSGVTNVNSGRFGGGGGGSSGGGGGGFGGGSFGGGGAGRG